MGKVKWGCSLSLRRNPRVMSRVALHKPSFGVVGVGLLCALFGAPAAAASDGPSISQWLAAGSGCKSGSSTPGDVVFRSAHEPSPNGHNLQAVLTLAHFRLRPLDKVSKGSEPSLTRYARECALRFSVVPPLGMRLAGVSARTEAEISKDENTKLLVQATLKVGAQTIAEEQRLFESSEKFRYRNETIALIPGRTPEQDMPSTGCDESKVVGADITFLVNKENASALAEARLAGAQEVRFDVSFEPCRHNSYQGKSP